MIQQRTVYALLHETTGQWCKATNGMIKTFRSQRDAVSYRGSTYLTTAWKVKKLVEKLERGE